MRIAKEDKEVQEVQTRFSFLNFLILVIVLLIIGSVFFVYNQIYSQHTNTEFTRSIANVLPLPAGSVNGDLFWYEEVFAFDSLAQIEEPDEDHFGSAIDAIVRQKIIGQIAGELGVSIDSIETGEDQWSQYSWTQEQYEDYVLEPLALSTAVDEAIYDSDKHQQSVIDELGHVLSLYESGVSFEDLAIQYSETAAGQFGGDVGYVCVDELDDGLEGGWVNEIDIISDIIELEDRFVVAMTYDQIESEDEEACTQIGLQMIVLYKNTLADVLIEYKEAAVVKIYGQ